MWVRRGLAGVIVCLAGLLAYLVFERSHTSDSVSAPDQPPVVDAADSLMHGFHYQQTKDTRVTWKVDAKQARMYEGQHEAVLDDVQVRLFAEEGKEEMAIQAEEGTINTATNNFHLINRRDPIRVDLVDGYTLYTPQLEWHDDKQEIHTQEAVRIVGHGLRITGKGLVGHMTTEEFTVLEDVRVDVSS